MKKFFLTFLIFFLPTSLLASDYSKLPTIQKTLFSTDEVHLSCFDNENRYLGLIVYSGETKLISFNGWKFEDSGIYIDKSSTEKNVKFPIPLESLEFASLNLTNFKLKISRYNNINLRSNPSDELLEALMNKQIFNYLKTEKPDNVDEIQCGVTWAFKIRPIKENSEIRKKILIEAIKESKKKECSGDHLKWNDCVAFRGDYVGEYKDGYMSGHGIQFEKFGNFYIGNFVEDYYEGKGTLYLSAWYENVTDYPLGNTAWTLTGLRKEGEWSENNKSEQNESLKKYSFF